MDTFAILLGYFDKQMHTIEKLEKEVIPLDLAVEENGYVLALKTQQLFTALEDLFKQIAKTFEKHIEDLGSYHRELLLRMTMEIPSIRPAVLTNEAFLLLDKMRVFRDFICHTYDCELDKDQLSAIQIKLKEGFSFVKDDLDRFRAFIVRLSQT